MNYLDTSFVVAALSNEAFTRRAQDWLAGPDGDELAISEWTTTEFASALALKLRTGAITLDDRARIRSVFTDLVADSFTVLAVAPLHFRLAATFVDRHTLGLRSGDALHLAVAADRGATLHTFDRRLAEAGPALGVSTLFHG